jgi:signal transduction histidine kinase
MPGDESLISRGDEREADRTRSMRWSTVPLVLVVVMLVGSVLVPARETSRIMSLLRETTDVVEPTRLLSARLEFGLTVESAALEGYALSGDSVQLTRYLAASAEDDRRLATIEDLARKLDPDAIDRAAAVRRRLGEWRTLSHAAVEERLDRAQIAVAMRAQRASYQQALRDVARLSAYLAAEGSARRELIHRSERLGLLVNASLVLIALAAVFAVSGLSHRERQLTGILQRRIDEEAALRHEAREGRAALERVMKSRSRMMRGFSHDVKNPLGAADGYAELLSAGIYGALSAEQSDRIECIRRSIRVALSLIDDLHEMARAETGHLELSPAPVDLGDLVHASAEEYRAAAATKGLSLSVNEPSGPLVVSTDRARVRQVLSNLLSNAIKYTARGSIILGVRRWPSHHVPQTDSWAVIDVTDSGRGVPAEKASAIFEEFIRLGAHETSGAGLGLAISQRLAHALGGQITLQSAVGSGSTFTLWLPLEKRPSSASPAVSTATGTRHASAAATIGTQANRSGNGATRRAAHGNPNTPSDCAPPVDDGQRVATRPA